MQDMSQLVQQMTELSHQKEEHLMSRMRDKDHEIAVLQALVDDFSEAQVQYAHPPAHMEANAQQLPQVPQRAKSEEKDRSFIDEYLLTVLREKDELALQLDSLSEEV